MGHLARLLCASITAGLVQAPPAAVLQSSGSIAGTVVTGDESPHPVRRAVVTAIGTGLGRTFSTLTDDTGRFTIDDVPIGSYAVVASRATFVTSAYGAQRPARRGRQVSVTADQPVSNLVLRLWRGAVLSGTARDDRGRPAPGVTVRAVSAAPPAAAYLTLTNNPTVTDSRGEFRIFGLEPGEYFLAAQPLSPSRAATALQDAYVDGVLDALRRTGRGVLAPNEPLAPAVAPDVTFSPVYWPGTVSAADAAAIVVAAGTERWGLDITLMQVPTASVAGRVVLPDGGPAGGAIVRLTDSKARPRVGGAAASYGATTQPDGSFVMDSVPAGSYEMSASLRVSSVDEHPGASGRTLWAIDRVETTGEDVHGVALQLGPGLTISGRIQIADASGPAELPDGVSVALLPASVASVSPTASLAAVAGGAAVMPDGTFVISHLRPEAEYRLFVNGMGPDLRPVSASLGSVDLFDGPAVLTASRSGERLHVTFSTVYTELFGTLSGDDLISPIFVVVFPSDRTLWGLERRTRAVQPDASGRYRFDNLPAGEYWLGAVGDVDPEAWTSPSFLERLEGQALKVVLGRGERRQFDLMTR